jgi:monoamine oxidase
VSVHTTDGRTFEADYALVTFSVGVLQNDDVVFKPTLPDWKQEAINSIVMVIRSFMRGVTCTDYTCEGDVYQDIFSVPGSFLV